MAITRRLFVAAFVAAAACASAPLPSAAHSYKAGDLTIGHPWSRATVSTTRPAVAYLSIANAGKDADKLVAADTPVAGRVELHRSRMDGGVMKMEPVDGIAVPAGGKVALAPGGYHLMLLEPKRVLKEGERFPLTLTFERAGKVEVTVKVEGVGGPRKKQDDGHGSH